MFTGNPLLGRDGLRRFRWGWGRTLWSVGVMVFIAHTPVYLVYLIATGDPIPDLDDAWIINLLAGSMGAMLIPIVALRRAPSGEELRGMLTDLRLAGLTPGQINVGFLRHVSRSLLIFQAIWLGLMLGPQLIPSLWEEINPHMGGDDLALLAGVFFDGLVTPWLLLVLGWGLLVAWRRLSRVAAVVVPLGIVLNPIGLLLIVMAMGL